MAEGRETRVVKRKNQRLGRGKKGAPGGLRPGPLSVKRCEMPFSPLAVWRQALGAFGARGPLVVSLAVAPVGREAVFLEIFVGQQRFAVQCACHTRDMDGLVDSLYLFPGLGMPLQGRVAHFTHDLEGFSGGPILIQYLIGIYGHVAAPPSVLKRSNILGNYTTYGTVASKTCIYWCFMPRFGRFPG